MVTAQQLRDSNVSAREVAHMMYNHGFELESLISELMGEFEQLKDKQEVSWGDIGAHTKEWQIIQGALEWLREAKDIG